MYYCMYVFGLATVNSVPLKILPARRNVQHDTEQFDDHCMKLKLIYFTEFFMPASSVSKKFKLVLGRSVHVNA